MRSIEVRIFVLQKSVNQGMVPITLRDVQTRGERGDGVMYGLGLNPVP